MTQLKNLSTDTSLSRYGVNEIKHSPLSHVHLLFCSKTTDLVVRVIQMQTEWNKSGDTVHTPSSQAVATAPVASKLNTDAPVFVPSGEIEFYYQQPVRNAGEN